MPELNNYRHHDPIAICDICGFKKHRSHMKKTWDGFLACNDGDNCWYPKHPADSPLPVIIDGQSIPDARPEQPDVFVTIPRHGYSKWNYLVSDQYATSGRQKWNGFHLKWGNT